MAWYGENRSGRDTPWKVGDVVQHDDGPSALMRIEDVVHMGADSRGIACSIRYYGRDLFGFAIGAYHGQCREASPEQKAVWDARHPRASSRKAHSTKA